MIAKSLVITILIASCYSIDIPRHVRFFGNIWGSQLWRYRYIGTEHALRMPNLLKENKITFTFPNENHDIPDEEFVINAIQQVDHSKHQAKAEIVSGGIGSNQVTMTVTAPKGAELGTKFHFYGQIAPRPKDAEQKLTLGKIFGTKKPKHLDQQYNPVAEEESAGISAAGAG